jgi:glycosyltransferase involved in cell wall biosynthesis
MKLLYISYFSIREPLVETQVISYLRELTKAGHEIWFLTFEPQWPESWTTEEIKERENLLAKHGIQWSALKYHKRPSLPATMWDIAVGAIYARKLARKHGIEVFHGRAHVASAMCALARWRSGCKMIFDIRGFNPEENVDAGRWKAGGLKYRLMKRAEMAILKVASGFVILTDAGRAIMFPIAKPLEEAGQWELPDGRPIEVIPCCVDLARFHEAQQISRDEAKARLNLSGKKVIAYVGALGGWYMTNEMVQIWAEAKKNDKNAFALIYTQSNSADLKNQLILAGLREDLDFRISRVSPAQLAPNLRAADVALSLIKPTYSKISSSPTKFAEYLAAGCVVISTSKIGDCDEQIETNKVGVILQSFSSDSIQKALQNALSLVEDASIEKRCFETANSIYSLENVGGFRYKRLYQRLF